MFASLANPETITIRVDANVAQAAGWARSIPPEGWVSYRLDSDEKRPMVRFRQWWEAMPPADLLDKFNTPNLQILLGRFYRLLVIDLDGPAARTWWDALPYRTPRTWTTHSGGDGLHLWFSVSRRLFQAAPRRDSSGKGRANTRQLAALRWLARDGTAIDPSEDGGAVSVH